MPGSNNFVLIFKFYLDKFIIFANADRIVDHASWVRFYQSTPSLGASGAGCTNLADLNLLKTNILK